MLPQTEGFQRDRNIEDTDNVIRKLLFIKKLVMHDSSAWEQINGVSSSDPTYLAPITSLHSGDMKKQLFVAKCFEEMVGGSFKGLFYITHVCHICFILACALITIKGSLNLSLKRRWFLSEAVTVHG